MSKKGQSTGIFAVEDVTEAIQLQSFEGTFKEEDTILITPPKLMIDVAELHGGAILFSLLDLANFIQFGDAVAVLTI